MKIRFEPGILNRIVLAGLLALVLAGCASKEPGSGMEPDGGAVVSGVSAERADLAKRLDAIFDAPEFDSAFWGVRVELPDGSVVYERNAGKSFLPASNMKVYTTAAALALLGPEFTYTTTLEARGILQTNGRFAGDLVMVGSGDPSLGTWRIPGRPDATQLLDRWAAAVRAMGAREVSGAVIGDGRVFTNEFYSGDWELSDLPFWYAAGTSGLTISENVFRFTTGPGPRPGAPAVITILPETRFITTQNDVVTTSAGARTDADIVHRAAESNVVEFGGVIAADKAPFEQRGSVWNGNAYAATLFVEALSRAGIPVGEGALDAATFPKVARFDNVPKPRRMVVATQDSPPVRELIRLVNKPSHNLYADALLRTLGAREGRGGDFASGAAVVKKWLASLEVPDLDRLRMLDGSGLARRDYITPRQMTALLRHMSHSSPRDAAIFRESLPIAGVDGDLRSRMTEAPLKGCVFAKTGYIGHVRALSGYLRVEGRPMLTFSFVANGLMVPISRADAATDAALLQLATHPATTN